MDSKRQLRRLARLKAERIYHEMVREGLTPEDLPEKLREVAEREEAAIGRLSMTYGIPSADARLLLQLAIDDEWVAEQGCRAFAATGSMMQAIAVLTLYNGDEYRYGAPQ